MRGDVLCTACAAALVGSQEIPPPVPRPRADLVAGAMFALAAVLTMLPWDRVGALSGFLSAWVPLRSPWAFATVVLTLLAAAASLRRREDSPWARRGRLAIGLAAAVAALLALPPPNLAARGPVPFIVAASLWAAVAVSVVREWRRP